MSLNMLSRFSRIFGSGAFTMTVSKNRSTYGLWAGAPEGDGLAARRRLLLLYRGLPKWVALEFILRGVASSAPRLQRLALQELAAWNGGFNRRMAPLPAEDRDQLRLLLDAVEHRIAAGMVAQLRFVLRA